MSRCGECKLGCNEEGALYCEENLGYEQCIDKLQDALYTADRPSGENCEFCRCHEKEDVLYELVDWDYGLAFDEIRNIKYCPLCGATLKGADDESVDSN